MGTTFVSTLMLHASNSNLERVISSLFILKAIFLGEPGLGSLVGAKDNGSDGDYWSC